MWAVAVTPSDAAYWSARASAESRCSGEGSGITVPMTSRARSLKLPSGAPVFGSRRIAAQDPLTGLQPPRVLFDAPEELPRRGGIAQAYRRQLEPAVDEVGVTVREPGQHEPTIRLNPLRLRARVAGQGRVVADGEYLAAGEGDGTLRRESGREAGRHP